MKLHIDEIGRQEVVDDHLYDYDSDIEPEPWDPSEGDEVRQRMEERKRAYEFGGWHMIGVRAAATTLWLDDDNIGVVGPNITTPGIWGVESDAGEEYLDKLYREELGTLIDMLKAMGFSDADIKEKL